MVGTSLRNSTSLISFPVRKPGQMGKLRYTQMKLIIVTGNRCKTIILIGGAQYISGVVRNLKFAVNRSVSPCPSYLFSLTSSTQMYGAVYALSGQTTPILSGLSTLLSLKGTKFFQIWLFDPIWGTTTLPVLPTTAEVLPWNPPLQ